MSFIPKRTAETELIELLDNVVKDLKQKLLASQASEVGLREALNRIRNEPALRKVSAIGGQDSYAGMPPMMRIIDEALSTPPNTAELEAYVESEIKRRFEVAAWKYKTNNVHTWITENEPPDDAYDKETLIPLYVKKG